MTSHRIHQTYPLRFFSLPKIEKDYEKRRFAAIEKIKGALLEELQVIIKSAV